MPIQGWPAGQGSDLLSGAGRPGEGNHVHARMAYQGLSDFGARAVHEVEDACGQPGLSHGLGQHEGAGRGDLGGLEHHGATRQERGGDLTGDLVQRIVPGRDASDHADRHLLHQRMADPELPFEAFGKVRIHVTGRQRCADLDARRELAGDAHFARNGDG